MESNKEILIKMEIKMPHTKNQKGTIEMSRTYNKERGLEEFDTHSIYYRTEKKQRITYLTCLSKWIAHLVRRQMLLRAKNNRKL